MPCGRCHRYVLLFVLPLGAYAYQVAQIFGGCVRLVPGYPGTWVRAHELPNALPRSVPAALCTRMYTPVHCFAHRPRDWHGPLTAVEQFYPEVPGYQVPDWSDFYYYSWSVYRFAELIAHTSFVASFEVIRSEFHAINVAFLYGCGVRDHCTAPSPTQGVWPMTFQLTGRATNQNEVFNSKVSPCVRASVVSKTLTTGVRWRRVGAMQERVFAKRIRMRIRAANTSGRWRAPYLAMEHHSASSSARCRYSAVHAIHFFTSKSATRAVLGNLRLGGIPGSAFEKLDSRALQALELFPRGEI
eukprot:1549177-Rhodomonas_salina.1